MPVLIWLALKVGPHDSLLVTLCRNCWVSTHLNTIQLMVEFCILKAYAVEVSTIHSDIEVLCSKYGSIDDIDVLCMLNSLGQVPVQCLLQ